MGKIIFYLTATMILALDWSVASALDQSNSSSFVVVRQQIPKSGITILKTISARSAINCGNMCSQFQGQACNGFIHNSSTCAVNSGGSSDINSGTCQLLSFASLAAVSFVHSTTSCQRFYLRSSLQCTGLGEYLEGTRKMQY